MPDTNSAESCTRMDAGDSIPDDADTSRGVPRHAVTIRCTRMDAGDSIADDADMSRGVLAHAVTIYY